MYRRTRVRELFQSGTEGMVTEINGKYVHPQEVLANAVYEYSRKERRLISR